MHKVNTESVKRLCKAITLLKTEKEVSDFLDDICTINEIQDMAQRLDTAILLSKEQLNYQTISKEVGVSTATISRVSRCLNFGSGGYSTVIERLYGTEETK